MCDPFVTPDNVITPLQINPDTPDMYSVKLTVKNCQTKRDQVTVYAGTFESDLNIRSVGLQNVILKTIETSLQQTIAPLYTMTETPSLKRPPASFTYTAGDIVVSFSGKNDFLIFNGSLGSRVVKFLTTGSPVQTYLPDDVGAPSTFTFTSGDPSGDTYLVEYTDYGFFNVTVTVGSNVNVLTFDLSNSISTFGTVTLVKETQLDGTLTFKSDFYTDVGISVLPAILSLPVTLATGSKGLFFNPGSNVTVNDLISHIETGYTFTAIEKVVIQRLSQALFIPTRNALYRVLNLDGSGVYSFNRGYGSFVTIGGISVELRVT